MKKQTSFAFALFSMLLLSIIFSSFTQADGGYYPRQGWVQPGEQRAVIFHENNQETMIVTSSFRGDAKNLVWIIPTPSKPTVTKASEKVLTNAQILTTPKYYGGRGMLLNAQYALDVSSEKYSGVQVLESKQIDYYDVNVLTATNANDLIKWFNDNDYQYSEEYSYVLNSYIQKGWYFIAVKVSPDAQGATEVTQDMKEGHPTPLKIVFLSDNIVFPLKISSVEFKKNNSIKFIAAKEAPAGETRRDNNGIMWQKIAENTWKSKEPGYEYTTYTDYSIDLFPGGINYYDYNDYPYRDYVPINLYVIAENKYEADSFYINYANKADKLDIEELGYDESNNPYISPTKEKYIITHLSASYQKSQMDDDLILRKANDDKKVNAGPEIWQLILYGFLIAIFAMVLYAFSPLGWIFIAGLLTLAFSSSRGGKITGKILSWFSFALTALICLGFLLLVTFSKGISDPTMITLIIILFVLLILMLLLILIISKYKGKTK